MLYLLVDLTKYLHQVSAGQAGCRVALCRQLDMLTKTPAHGDQPCKVRQPSS
jgi:hypothetical protein